MRKIFLFAAALMSTAMFAQLQVATFEDVTIGAPESVLHLSESGAIQSGSFFFTQEVADYGDYGVYYFGNLPSNKTGDTFASLDDAEKSASGGAYEGENFNVWTASYSGLDGITLEEAAVVPGFFINNSAYAVNSMSFGDGYAKKFDKNDWFKLTIDATLNGQGIDTQVTVYLAANGEYINKWTYVDLSQFGPVDAIKFTLTSSDTGDYGMNTPAYFCIDNFGAEKPEGYVEPKRAKFLEVATFEDVTIGEPESVLHLAETGAIQSGSFSFAQEVSVSEWGTYFFGNLPSNKTGNTFASLDDAEKSASGGAYEGENFNVWTASYYAANGITLEEPTVVPGFFINNSAYAVHSMCNGDSYAKKFDKDDWFRLTIGAMRNGEGIYSIVFVDLAADGEYIDKWTYVDLSEFGKVDAIYFTLTSSDTGDYGMNTPAYFCIDNFGATKPWDYVEPERAKFDGGQGIEDVEAGVKAFKVLRDGQIIIVRGEAEYNITGQSVK
jgi:hypothetical protein